MSVPIDKLQRQLDRVPWLRGRGPVSYDYGQWVDETHHLLVTLFGQGSAQEAGFLTKDPRLIRQLRSILRTYETQFSCHPYVKRNR